MKRIDIQKISDQFFCISGFRDHKDVGALLPGFCVAMFFGQGDHLPPEIEMVQFLLTLYDNIIRGFSGLWRWKFNCGYNACLNEIMGKEL